MSIDPVQQFLAGLPFKPDPFQYDAIQALSEGRSVLVAAPTGTGKTVVAEFAVHLALARGLRALYTTPIKALSNQKFRDFRARYNARPPVPASPHRTGPGVPARPHDVEAGVPASPTRPETSSRTGEMVGLLTGDLVENASGRLLVMTTEVARNMLVQDPGSFGDVGCLVFDEVHYLADPERGTAWEESILLAPAHVPLVCLSATVANAEEIADWIRATGRDVALIQSADRVVPLKHRYYLDGALHPVLEGKTSLPSALKRIGGERAGNVRTGNNGWSAGGKTDGDSASAPNAPEVVKALDASDLLPAIYFLFSRRAVEEAAESCLRLNLLPHARAADVRELARDRLGDLPAEDRSLPQVERLLALLPKGIGFHHAGILPPLKTLVEELLAAGVLKVVFATDTLALGINVPARSVVLGEMIKFDGQSRRLISPGEYRQLTGRAGRRGMDPVGYSILLHSPWVALDRGLEIATGDVDPLESAFRPGYSTILNLWQGPGQEERLSRLVAGSLRQFQQGSKIRTLADEREELATALNSIPAGCPLDGGPTNWLERERALQRELERATSALETARSERRSLEERICAWPWQYTKNQKKTWLRSASQGEVVYSRRLGWGAYVGPSSEGIGEFSFGSEIVSLASYAELDYLPDPPIQTALTHHPSPITHHAPATALQGLDLPDVEAAAREAAARARAANAHTLAEVDRRVAAVRERHRSASLTLAQSPCRNCHLRASHRRSEREKRSYAGLLTATERDLEAAQTESRRRAERTLRSLRAVLERLGYMSAGNPTPKARVLMRIFDSNGLIISELLDLGVLADASAHEVAEAASWFAFDREGAGRALATTERLARVRAAVDAVSRKVLDAEQRLGVKLSRQLSPDFRGVALAWAAGSSLSDLSARSGLAEGDIVFTLQKTIDLCRQMRQAAAHSRTPSLARRAAEAERLLRRGVVDSYYRWVIDA